MGATAVANDAFRYRASVASVFNDLWNCVPALLL